MQQASGRRVHGRTAPSRICQEPRHRAGSQPPAGSPHRARLRQRTESLAQDAVPYPSFLIPPDLPTTPTLTTLKTP